MKTKAKIINYIRNKQCHDYKPQINAKYWKTIEKVLPATYMFVSEDFGTAVCLSADGLILTCHHCVEDGDDLQLISFDGIIYRAKMIYSDERLDLAILKINSQKQLSFVDVCKTKVKMEEIVFCIGNPADVDLQSKKKKKTPYRPFNVSKGRVEGYLEDQIYGDEQRGLGPLKHNCWTYWGHSGAPIFNKHAELIGVHNSWDQRDATRHGLSGQSISLFLQQFARLQ